MEGMQKLNADGCGVCKKADWSKYKTPTRWEKFKDKILSLFKKPKPKKAEPWCTIHKKYVDQMHRCMQYCPKKQMTIWGAAQDEEVKVTKGDLRGSYVGM